MTSDPFEEHLRRFKLPEADAALRSRVLQSIQQGLEKPGWKYSAGVFLRSWRWELALACVILALVFADAQVQHQVSLTANYQELESRREAKLDAQCLELAKELGNGESLARLIKRHCRFSASRSLAFRQVSTYRNVFNFEDLM